jgi:LuxR family maltose regulon positive regulatory protein
VRRLAGTDASVEDYLMEEVLGSVSDEMARFLRRTSVLGRLNGPLCAAVLDDDDAHDLLDEACRSNLFVTAVDERSGWFRYHQVFADLLRQRLDAREPAMVPVLQARASAFFAEHDDLHQAIVYAAASGDGRRAARLLHDAERYRLLGHEYAAVRRLIDVIPADRGEYGPFCDALYALTLVLEGAEPSLVYERWQRLLPHREAPGVARLVDQALVWPFYGHVTEARDVGRRAYAAYRDETAAVWHAIAAVYGLALYAAGERAAARAVLERHLGEIVFPNARSWALATLSFAAVDEHDGPRAVACAEEAVALAEDVGGRTALEYSLAWQALANARCSVGDTDGAVEAVRHAGGVTSRLPGSLHHAVTVVVRARIALARRERSYARAAVVEARRIVERHDDVGVLETGLAQLEAALRRRGDDGLRGSLPTPAEQRLLELLPSELTLQQIADRAFIARSTANSHVRRLYRRLGVNSRVEAVRVARERGLL